MADNRPSLAIIIVTYNSADEIARVPRLAGRAHRAVPDHDHRGRQRLHRRHGGPRARSAFRACR